MLTLVFFFFPLYFLYKKEKKTKKRERKAKKIKQTSRRAEGDVWKLPEVNFFRPGRSSEAALVPPHYY